jgi:L-asparaginase II
MSGLDGPAPVLVRVMRDGFIESVHRGHVAVCTSDGEVVAFTGDAEQEIYPRSALKPFQAMATLRLLDEAGVLLDVEGLAIACASHDGTDTHQIEAARLLAEAGLDETALQCPPAEPGDDAAFLSHGGRKERLAHNCSGKHAGFLLAQVAAGQDPAAYLDVDSQVQVRAKAAVEDSCSTTLTARGVDGCGAPAWRMPLRALATGFARLAGGATPRLARVRDAMTARPDLVGGDAANDTALMRADGRVVAKRGAEAVLAAGFTGPAGPIGVAVKIADGYGRADAPVVAAVLESYGAGVPGSVRRPVVLGGGRPHGAVETVLVMSTVPS